MYKAIVCFMLFSNIALAQIVKKDVFLGADIGMSIPLPSQSYIFTNTLGINAARSYFKNSILGIEIYETNAFTNDNTYQVRGYGFGPFFRYVYPISKKWAVSCIYFNNWRSTSDEFKFDPIHIISPSFLFFMGENWAWVLSPGSVVADQYFVRDVQIVTQWESIHITLLFFKLYRAKS